MARVKRSVARRKKRRKVLDQAKGYVGQSGVSYRKAKEADPPRRQLRLPRPQEQEARLPAALDHPHQRRRPEGRPLVQPVRGRLPQGGDRARPQDPRGARGERPARLHGDRPEGQGRAPGLEAVGPPPRRAGLRGVSRHGRELRAGRLAALRAAGARARRRPARGRARGEPRAALGGADAALRRNPPPRAHGRGGRPVVARARGARGAARLPRALRGRGAGADERGAAGLGAPAGLPRGGRRRRDARSRRARPERGPQPPLGPLPLPLPRRDVGRGRTRRSSSRARRRTGRPRHCSRAGRSCADGSGSTAGPVDLRDPAQALRLPVVRLGRPDRAARAAPALRSRSRGRIRPSWSRATTSSCCPGYSRDAPATR